jgi:hypothetical protein
MLREAIYKVSVMKKVWLLALVPVIGLAGFCSMNKPQLAIMKGMDIKHNSVFVQEEGGLSYSLNSNNITNELGSSHAIFLAGEFVKKFGPTTRIPKYKNLTALDVSKSLLRARDYSLAEVMWNDLGNDQVQTGVRKAANNNSIKIGNGLGCVKIVTEQVTTCRAEPGANEYSERDLTNYLLDLDKYLSSNELSLKNFIGDFENEPRYSFVLKTLPSINSSTMIGTAQNIKTNQSFYTIAGSVTGVKSKKRFYYTLNGTGNSNDVYSEQLKIIKTLNDN